MLIPARAERYRFRQFLGEILDPYRARAKLLRDRVELHALRSDEERSKLLVFLS
jgi:hypothetical protein